MRSMTESAVGLSTSSTIRPSARKTARSAYEAAGSKPFRPYADRAMTMPYYRVPVGVLEAAPTLVEWASALAHKAKPLCAS